VISAARGQKHALRTGKRKNKEKKDGWYKSQHNELLVKMNLQSKIDNYPHSPVLVAIFEQTEAGLLFIVS